MSENTKPKKVILDVDTGSDDAVAIMTALQSDELDVVAICCVWGNLSVEDTTENTCRLVRAMGKDTPVYMGAPTAIAKYLERDTKQELQPIIKDGKEVRIHYKRLEGLEEPTDKKAEDMDAVSFYIDYLKHAKEKVTIITVAPMTNLGLALSAVPSIAENIEELIIMGGTDRLGNVSECAEANIWHDPEAAQIALNAGVPTLFVSLDATHSAALTLEDAETLRNLGTFAGGFTAKIIEQRAEFDSAMAGKKLTSTPVHDSLAVCAAIDPTVITESKKCNVRVALSGIADGRTIIDRRSVPSEPNCVFAFRASHDRYMEMLVKYLGK